MLKFLWSALSALGTIVLIILIVVLWTLFDRSRSRRHSDDISQHRH